jgi:hypothetical protein
MTRKILAGLHVWLAVSVPPVFAADVHCPETIPVKQTLLKQFEGWRQSASDLPIRLAGVTFYDGPPEQKASLVYDSESPSRGKRIAIWRFAPRSEIWLACSYAATNVVLSRPLPRATSTCRVTYISNQTVAGLPVIEKIQCQ